MTTTTTKDYYLQLVAQKIWSLSLQKQRSYDNFNDFANSLQREGGKGRRTKHISMVWDNVNWLCFISIYYPGSPFPTVAH